MELLEVFIYSTESQLLLNLNIFRMFNILLQHTYCKLLEKVFLGALLIKEFFILVEKVVPYQIWAKMRNITPQVGQRLNFHLLKSISFLRRGENQAKLVQPQSQPRFVGSDLCFTKNVKETPFVFHLTHTAVFSNN